MSEYFDSIEITNMAERIPSSLEFWHSESQAYIMRLIPQNVLTSVSDNHALLGKTKQPKVSEYLLEQN